MLSLRWKGAIGMVLALWIGLLVIILAWVGARTRSSAGAKRLRIGPETSLEALSPLYYRHNLGGACLWSYSFVDPDRQKLERAVQWLRSDVYRAVAIEGPLQREAGFRFILQAEKIERFRADGPLLAKNNSLRAFAREQGIESYEGMEVGIRPSGQCE